jgi:SPP1 gp7 family putative phage head morphogenesis protein
MKDSSAINLGYAFTLAPAKAVEYFRRKGHRISWDWYDTYQEANAKAFTVAKAVRLDVLKDIRGAVDDAIANGTTFAQFKKDLEPTLRNKGWWGKQIVVNSQGVAEQVQLGSVRRLKTIYGTNLQTAYMAGRWKGMVENASERPYWQYIAIDDAATRAKHRAMNKRVFRWDDLIWQSIYPPNDWGCRCRVRALTEKQVKQKGLTVESSDGKLRESLELVSKRTGELQSVTGFDLGGGERFKPGVGWSYNPGAAHWQPDLDKYPYSTAKQYAEGVLTGPPFERFYSHLNSLVTFARETLPDATDAALRVQLRPRLGGDEFPVAVLNKDYQAAIGAKRHTVWLSDDTLVKQQINRKDALTLAAYRQVQPTLQEAILVVQDRAKHLMFYRAGDSYYAAVLKATGGGKLYLQSFRHSSAKEVAAAGGRGNVVLDKR